MVAGWFGVEVTARVTSTHLCNFDPSVSSKIGDLWRVYLPDIYPCTLSLVIPSWVGAVSTGNGFRHRWGRNGAFCVAAGPVTRTTGML